MRVPVARGGGERELRAVAELLEVGRGDHHAVGVTGDSLHVVGAIGFGGHVRRVDDELVIVFPADLDVTHVDGFRRIDRGHASHEEAVNVSAVAAAHHANDFAGAHALKIVGAEGDRSGRGRRCRRCRRSCRPRRARPRAERGRHARDCAPPWRRSLWAGLTSSARARRGYPREDESCGAGLENGSSLHRTSLFCVVLARDRRRGFVRIPRFGPSRRSIVTGPRHDRSCRLPPRFDISRTWKTSSLDSAAAMSCPRR